MNQPARRKTDADATRDESLGDESLGRDRDILWKTFPMSSEQAYEASLIARKPGKIAVILLIHSQAVGPA